MGCASSKIETEAVVKQSKARKDYIKQAVAHRHAFAAAHASYAKALKSTGAAIRQMAEVEAIPEGTPQPAPAAVHAVRQQTVSNLLPPPHPPEDPFLMGPRTPLPRAASMPPIPIKSSLGGSPSRPSPPQALTEDNEESYEDQGFPPHKSTHSETLYDPFDNFTSTFDGEDSEGPEAEDDEGRETIDDEVYQAQTPVPLVRRSVDDKAALGRETNRLPQVPPVQQKVGKADRNFGTVLHEIDDFFLESYEAAGEVSRLLEAKRDYHHAPFVDERHGIENHNKKVSKILTWTQSSPGENLANDDESGVDNLASTLDRLHAWEKKLYDEVKAAEATRLELTRRSAQLRNLRDGYEASSTFEKTKALVKSLNTRYLVEFEAMGAAYSEVQKLRDESLYPQLMNLLEALKLMWKVMHDCHESQVQLVEELSNLATPSTDAMSEHCKKITEDLEREVSFWHNSLEDMVRFQEKCVTCLLEWLHLKAVDYFPASQDEDIPLHDMCQKWADAVKLLSAEQVLYNLKHFSSLLQVVAARQTDEIKQKRRKEELLREYEKKKKAFEAFEKKYNEKASARGIPQVGLESSRHPIQERKALVELLQKNVAEEEQRHAQLCEENSTMIFESLREGLPGVVHSVAAFSRSCAQEYNKLLNRVRLEKIPSEVSPS